MSKKQTWVVYEVFAGDRRKDWTVEQRMSAAARGDLDALGPEPEHHFYVVAPDDFELGVALAPVFKKFNALTSDDLPKPFNMNRLEGEVEATEETVADAVRDKIGDVSARREVLVATRALYREVSAEAKSARKARR